MPATQPTHTPSTEPIQSGRWAWPGATSRSKPWTRWWWLGSAVDRAGLTAALEAYAAAGIGGVEVCPIYGATGAEARFVPFLTKEWLALLDHAIAEAKRLGMGLDLTTGTGWPFGGPSVGAEQASCRLNLAKQDVTGGATLDQALPKGTFEHAVAVDEKGNTVDLSRQVSGGRIRWDAPAGGAWQAVIATRQAPIQKVKRAAPGGEGNVVDPYSTTALDHYLAAFDAALAGERPKPNGHFHDSFEYYNADWTPAMLAEFQQRRGYDLRPHLAELAGIGDERAVARVRCDYHQTLGELHLDYVVHWMEWCHRHGGVSREQAHGAPANLIDLYAASDVPETEHGFPPSDATFPVTKFASSAANLAGRPMTSAEAFTWLGEHFNVTLAEVKVEADWLLLAGVNRNVFHGIPYSPADVAWPGWLFYAAVNFGPNGGLWHDLPALTAYLARCQGVLQSGRPSRDVLLYFPVCDFWQTSGGKLLMQFTADDKRVESHPFGVAAMALRHGGYLFDAVSDHFLSTASTVDGRVQIGGMRYATIVVPPCRVMPHETAQRLLDLAKAGAAIVFQSDAPDDVPGLHDADARQAALRSAIAGLRALKGNRVVFGSSLEQALLQTNTPREPMADLGLHCERRAHDDGHSYFIVNRGTAGVDAWVPLGTPAASAVLLDPRADDRTGTAAVRQRDGRAEVYLQLGPGESVVLQTFAAPSPLGRGWPYTTSAGEPRVINGTWQVTFIEGGPALPASFETDRLTSWTDRDDAGAKRFAGTARYRIEFDHAAGQGVDDWQLDLGRVAESARVRVNGHDAGVAWCAPLSLQVGRWLRTGKNVLEVDVTNLAANRIADLDRRGVPWKKFHEINFVNKNYKPFDASGWPLRASGLLGPVRLLPVRHRPVNTL